MPRCGLPGLLSLQAPAASAPPVSPRPYPASPGPFPVFPRRAPLWPAPSGTCPFYSRLSRLNPPASAPCRYPADRPCHPPASCGQKGGLSGCPLETCRFWTSPLETCRFWTSGHHGPKRRSARYPRPQTAVVGTVRGKALPGQPVRGECSRYPPVRGECSRYPPAAPAFENSVCPVSFRWRIPPFRTSGQHGPKYVTPASFPVSYPPGGYTELFG